MFKKLVLLITGLLPVGLYSASFVVDNQAQNASDSNSGTVQQPWKTVIHAVKQLKAGDHLLIKPGIYYGRVDVGAQGTKDQRIVIEGSELGKVIISGAKTIISWRRLAPDSRVYVAEHNPKNLYSFYYKYRCSKSNKYARHYNNDDSADLSMDKMILFFHDDVENLPPGSWNIDRKKKKIYTRLPDDSDPNNHLMEVCDNKAGIWFLGRPEPKYVTIRNLVIERAEFGIRLTGKAAIIENNIIKWCRYRGVFNQGPNHIIRNNTITWSGEGAVTMGARSKVLNNRLLFSNWKLCARGWDAAGLKGCEYGPEGWIIGNESAYNGALGIWLDIFPSDTVVKDNIVHDNVHAGLENEISISCHWNGNLSYRNFYGFYLSTSSGVTFKNNLLYDNKCGVYYLYSFKRNNNHPMKEYVEKAVKRLRRLSYTDAEVQGWHKQMKKYILPNSQFRDNIVSENLLINNETGFMNNPLALKPAEKDKWAIAGTQFKNNIIIGSNSDKIVAGYASLAEYQQKSKDGVNCKSYGKLNVQELPLWAQKLYRKHQSRISYPRSYQSQSVQEIYQSLCVVDPPKQSKYYRNFPAPAGLFALANICESKLLKPFKTSNPYIKGYFINYRGEKTLILWRVHGKNHDFAPILLKDVPASARLEMSCGTNIQFQRKGNLTSINLGTWPLYLIGAGDNISEVMPFELIWPETIVYNQPLEIIIKNPIGHGELIVDANQSFSQCPKKLKVNTKATSFKVTLQSPVKMPIIRLAGTLNGLYVGGIYHLMEKEKKSWFTPGKQWFDKPLSLKEFANSNRSTVLNMDPKHGSLKKLPEQIKVGSINFSIPKGKSLIGLKSQKNKVYPESVILKPDKQKIDAMVFLLVCSYAPEEMGKPLLKITAHYDDLLAEEVFIENKKDIIDWWHKPTLDQERMIHNRGSKLAWCGDNGFSHNVYVYAYFWRNSKPDNTITSLYVNTADPEHKARLGILAVTSLRKVSDK